MENTYQKKIKPYAIVPPELYVKRDADRQLRQIIQDMGRPGYVLVSRQMGKTNLLLNAKREFADSPHCFVYLDVSNTFGDQRDFFRNLIDTCIDSSGEAAVDTAVKIAESRQKTVALQAHREHEFELKTVIDSIAGNLIICLDEIDALSKVDYSDNVFSLIRSIYFSGRTNSPQLKRLTYVLSGVADPAELIKNKSVSPFNIGEKIYLNDFSLAECARFIEASGLLLDQSVIERVYYWTSGYPRVTWDVCSALEARLTSVKLLNPADVDQVVKDLYMLNYDLPPFDHIRARVAKDRDIRNSIMSIHYGRSSTISDKMKDRLYLSGICTPKSDDGSVSFKNLIMANALSEKWISEIEHDSATFFERASLASKEGNYAAAIELYKEALDQPIPADARNFLSVELATSYMHAGQYPLAIKTFEECILPSNSGLELKHRKSHNYGVCLLLSRNYSAAIREFDTLLNTGSREDNGSYYYETHVNLATALTLQSSETGDYNYNSENYVRAERLLKHLVNSSPVIATDLQPQSAQKILLSAHYKLFEIYYEKGELESAKEQIDAAINLGESTALLLLEMRKIQLTQDESAQRDLYKKFSEKFVANRLILAETVPMDIIQFTSERCAELIINLLSHKLFDEAHDLCSYLQSTDNAQGTLVWNILHRAIALEINKQNYNLISTIATTAFRFSENATPFELRVMLVFALLSPDENQLQSSLDIYLRRVLPVESYILEDHDFRIIWMLAHFCLDQKSADKHYKLLELAQLQFDNYEQTQGGAQESVKAFAILLIFLNFRASATFGKDINLPEKLMPYIDELSNLRTLNFPIMPRNFGLILEKQFRHYSDLKQPAQQEKIGRNTIVTVELLDGKQIKGKYKRFSERLARGECKVVKV
jgi:tetratricopeptide (TPR) repeat protein